MSFEYIYHSFKNGGRLKYRKSDMSETAYCIGKPITPKKARKTCTVLTDFVFKYTYSNRLAPNQIDVIYFY